MPRFDLARRPGAGGLGWAVDLAGLVSVMNRSATEDARSPAWPVVSEVLRGGEAPSELAQQVVELMDAWVADDAPRLDADEDGFNDHAGPTIMDALWGPLAKAAMRAVFGDLTDASGPERFDGAPPELPPPHLCRPSFWEQQLHRVEAVERHHVETP